jgi:hypothetical protein
LSKMPSLQTLLTYWYFSRGMAGDRLLRRCMRGEGYGDGRRSTGLDTGKKDKGLI